MGGLKKVMELRLLQARDDVTANVELAKRWGRPRGESEERKPKGTLERRGEEKSM